MGQVGRGSERRRVRHRRKNEQWRPTDLQCHKQLGVIHNIPKGWRTSSSVWAQVTKMDCPSGVSRAKPDETVTL
jgi:hypothetical protein